MFGSKDLLFTSETYGVAKSLRFRYSAGTNLTRTPSSNTSGTKCTFSTWIKLGSLQTSTNNGTFIADSSGNVYAQYYNNTLYFGNASFAVSTAAVFRDFSSWYHVFFVVDSTLGTTNDRMQIWVNGVRQTVGTFNIQPGASDTVTFLNSNTGFAIGGRTSAGSNTYFDGYLAEVNFIDGQALTPSSFGFYDNNGIWQPQGYTGTYGTNGFYLKFTDVGATSGNNVGYGKDFSGFNTNYWTTNNFGTTSNLTTYDSMLDSPTNAAGDIGNYCVLNPISNISSGSTISDGNLKVVTVSSGDCAIPSTIGMQSSGKYYAEFTCTAGIASAILGLVPNNYASAKAPGYNSNSVGLRSDGLLYNSGAQTSSWSTTWTTNNVMGIAYDASAGTVEYYKNGSKIGSTITGFTSGPYFYAVGEDASAATATWEANFGQRPFAYTPPSGFSALNTQNLTTPTISNGAAYMAAVTYTGSASTQNVTATSTNSGNNPNAVTFQPDLVWIKDRTNAQSHKLTDAVRGTTKAISTDSTAAEATDANGVTAFINNGFSLGTGTRAYSDSNLDSYVAWEWKEGVSQGFDIVSYAGDNTSNRNISHNLGVAPDFVWVKSLSTGSFYIWHRSLSGNTSFLKCNSTDGTNGQTTTNTPWGTGNWSSTQFMVTNNATNNLNAASTSYIAYLWDAIAGYSAMGIYTANAAATDGPFVYCGFRPRWVIVKATTAISGNWVVIDTSRLTYNQNGTAIYPNLTNTEITTAYIDFLSNGFKIRNNSTNMNNTSSDTYIWAAFAENPFKIARAC